MNKTTAQAAFTQLKKGLSSIALDILSVDSIGYDKRIKECEISALAKMIKSSCTDDSLYSLIQNDDETNIENLHKSFNQEINGFYRNFKSKSNHIIDKNQLSKDGNCSLNDRTAFQISTLVSNIKFSDKAEQLKEAYNLDPTNFSLKSHFKDEELDYFESIPYFRELIYSNDISSESFDSLPSSLVNNTNIKTKVVSKLKLKCEKIYKKSVDSLCNSSKRNSTLNYKQTRKTLRSIKENKLEFQAQYLDYICLDRDTKDISKTLNSMNEDLPESQQKLAPIQIVANTYNSSIHSVRERLCSFIPDQVDSIEDGLKKMGCTDGKFNDNCIFLETYKKLIDQSKEPDLNLDVSTNIANVKPNKKSSKGNFIFNKPSALVSSFIAIEAVEEKEENESEIQKEVVTVEKETSKTSVPSTVPKTKSVQASKANKKSFTSTKTSNQQIQNKQTYSPKHNSVSSNFTQESQKDKEMNEFYKGLAEKIKRAKKNKTYTSKSTKRSQEILNKSKRNLNKAKEIMRNISNSQDTNNNSLSNNNSNSNYQNDEDIEEMVQDQMNDDTSFGSHGNLKPSRGIASNNKKRRGSNSNLSSESIEKGYAYQNIFGDEITKQGVEAHYIDNKGFQGEIIGDKALEFVFLGELEQDPDKINLDEILNLDSSKGDVDSLVNSISIGKPFFIRSASSPNERILVKPTNGGFEFIKYSENESREFKSFYRKVKKAFKKKFYAKTRSKNSVVSVSGY